MLMYLFPCSLLYSPQYLDLVPTRSIISGMLLANIACKQTFPMPLIPIGVRCDCVVSVFSQCRQLKRHQHKSIIYFRTSILSNRSIDNGNMTTFIYFSVYSAQTNITSWKHYPISKAFKDETTDERTTRVVDRRFHPLLNYRIRI